jgi:internalin A
LRDKYHSKNQINALVLLLEVLKDRIDQDDACYDRLTNLAEELRSLFQRSSNAPQTHNEPVKTPSTSQVGGSSVFISYSHNDSRYLQEFKTHLKYYIREYNIEAWDDTRIAIGSNWQEAIEKALQSTKVAVLLISPDFLASDFIAYHELPPLFAAAEQRSLTILSIILRPSAFEDTPLSRFQSINASSNPLATMPPAKRDEIWNKAAEIVRNILREPSPNP